jgi:C-terminal processing protease CtpA/Prc
LRFTSSDLEHPELPGWPAPDPAAIQARAAGFSEVRRLPGACLLRLDSLESLTVSQPYLSAVAALAVGAPRVILDLRANRGGDVATVAALAGWLLGDDSRLLSEVTYQDRRRQWWTPALPLGTAYRGEVAVLVSDRTFSSAEALAYHLSVRGRAQVIGETTRGAADHIVPVRLARRVLAFLPEAEVRDCETDDNWEQTGVIPDVECPAAEALDRVMP